MKNKQNYYKYFYVILCLCITELPAENTQSIISKSDYGQKIFKKKLRRLCKRTAANFAQMHTVEEWKRLKKSNSFGREIHKICPKSIHHVKEQWIEPLFVFATIYAKDTKKYTQ